MPVVPDTVVEPNETFTVQLSNPVGAAIANGTGLGTIVDDDDTSGWPVTAPSGLTGVVAGNALSFSWRPPSLSDPPVLAYLLEAGFSPGQTAVSMPLPNVPSFSVVAPDGVYFVRVRAQRTTGLGPPSNEVVVATGQAAPPLPPQGLLATVQGTGITFAWTHGVEGPTVAGFQLRAGHAAGVADVGVVPLPAGVQSFTVTAPPDTYHVWVVAVNAAGASAASNVAVVTPAPGACTSPSPPSSLRAFATPGGVSLGWDAPSSGAIPVSYHVVAGSTSGGSDRGSATLPGSQHGLAAAVPPGPYFIRVTAVNACGTSAPSNEATATVP